MDNGNSNNLNNNILSNIFFIVNIVLITVVVSVFFFIYAKKHELAVVPKPEVKVVVRKPYIDNAKLTAKAAYVYDINNKSVLYKKNENDQLPLASLAKIMMALTAVELFPKNTNITIKKEFLAENGDSGLIANESWKLSDLLDFSLVTSSNDGARSVASVIGAMQLNSEDYDLGRKEFVKLMNEKAAKLGLSNTYFVNESGLDIGSTSGGYGTAEDTAKLLVYILQNRPEILEATKYKSLFLSSENKGHVAKNTNEDVDRVPGLIASKTGYTNMAGGNLAIAFDASIGRPIVVIVLGSTPNDRFTDVETLVKASLEQISK